MRVFTTVQSSGNSFYLIPENIPETEQIASLDLSDYTIDKTDVTIAGKAMTCLVIHPCNPEQ